MSTLEEYFEIGYINKTHGLKGEVQLLVTYTDFDRVKDFDFLFVSINNKMTPFFITQLRIPNSQSLLLAFEGVDDINAAQRIIKKQAFLPIKLKPKPKKNAFYWTDIVGFDVQDEHYGSLGKVLEVKEYPQQFVAFILYQEREAMFPLHPDLISKLDTAKKTLNTKLPNGILEVYLE